MLAIIPARRGSKGLPGKNIRLLHGKPMIAYTILAALHAKNISRVIVSTDCPKIAETAIKYGAEVPFLRPSSLAGDESLAIDTYLYTIAKLAENEQSSEVSELCVLLPTAPLRTTEDIEQAIALFREKQADSVISFTQAPHPLSWYKTINSSGQISHEQDKVLANRQNEVMSYYPNGAIYIFKTELLRVKRYYSHKSYAYLMPPQRSIDVDEIADFEYAEYLMEKRNGLSNLPKTDLCSER